MNSTTIKLTTALLLLISMSAAASAAPGVPHQFYGEVLVNGEPAPDLYVVEAVIAGNAKQTFTMEGSYGREEIFYIEDPQYDRLGERITFYVGPDEDDLVKAETTTFINGQSTRLDLSVEIDVQDDDRKSGSSGGGSSGGSSIIINEVAQTDQDEATLEGAGEEQEAPAASETECQTDWICTSWGECINGQQSRTCADANRCDTEAGKPAQKQSCEQSVEELYGGAPDEKEGVLNRLTGAVTGGGAGTWGALIGLLLVIGGVVGYVKTRKH